jgi:hypothetical protein
VRKHPQPQLDRDDGPFLFALTKLSVVHIGLSVDPEQLTRQHARHAAGGAHLLAVKPSSTRAEAMHVQVHVLQPSHIRHQWYLPSPEVVDWVRRLPVQLVELPEGWPPPWLESYSLLHG